MIASHGTPVLQVVSAQASARVHGGPVGTAAAVPHPPEEEGHGGEAEGRQWEAHGVLETPEAHPPPPLAFDYWKWPWSSLVQVQTQSTSYKITFRQIGSGK